MLSHLHHCSKKGTTEDATNGIYENTPETRETCAMCEI